ncbi:MAG: TatD family hydrolase [Thermoplasmata archaeon]|nr:MAG: TatD family hydrolase [Thermoplasmata archaeon]
MPAQDTFENKIPILDNHIHLDPRGQMEENIKRFAKAGGTHVVIVNKPYREGELLETKSYQKTFDLTLSMADKCRESCPEVGVYVVLGPYPVDLLRLTEKMSISDAKKVMCEGMELAKKYVVEGAAIAIGEIGRPHFQVEHDIIKCSNEILTFGMECAKDAGCPVVLHTESASEAVWRELAEMADSVKLPREKVIKHFAPPAVQETENFGLFPSILASKHSVKEAVARSDRFMMETDFLDDPARPGAVLGITTVPKVTKMLLQNELADEDKLIRIHKDNAEKLYGIEM